MPTITTTTTTIDGKRQCCAGLDHRYTHPFGHTVETYTTVYLPDGRRYHFCADADFSHLTDMC